MFLALLLVALITYITNLLHADLDQAYPFVLARPNASLAVSLQLPP